MYLLTKTFSSLIKANFLGMMIMCAVLAIIVVASLVILVTWLTAHFINFEQGWLDTLFTWGVGAISGIGGWFMLPALTVLISGIFQEKVIQRVEAVDYPNLQHHTESKFWPDLWHDIKFTVWVLFLNLLILPLYILGIGFVISILLNAYLLGREFFESAAGYYLGKPQAKELGQKNMGVVYAGGLVITLMTLVPLLNLFVPIIAIVWMLHAYHRLD